MSIRRSSPIVLSYLEADQAARGADAAAGEHARRNPDAHRDARRRASDGARRARRGAREAVRRATAPARPRADSAGRRRPPEILNLVGTAQEATLMAQIAKVDEPLSQKLQDLMFVFEDLVEVDDRGMQELLREVPGDKLIIALKAADETLKEKFFKNMSERAGQMMKDDLEAKGPVRLSEVEAAQKEILVTARAHGRGRAPVAGRQGRGDLCLRPQPPRAGNCRRSTDRCSRAAGARPISTRIEREAWEQGLCRRARGRPGRRGAQEQQAAQAEIDRRLQHLGIDPGLHGQADRRARRPGAAPAGARWPARSHATSCGASSRLQPDDIVAVIRDTVSLLPVTAREVRVHLQSRGRQAGALAAGRGRQRARLEHHRGSDAAARRLPRHQ